MELENENLVTEEVTENVEQTTEETVNQPEMKYTQADVDRMVKEKLDEVMPGKIARTRAKIEREYERTYGGLVNVLKAGFGAESVEDATNKLTQYYQGKGVEIPQQTSHTERDTELLARAEANEIIESGFDEVVEEVDRLKNMGANMTQREKLIYKTLAEYRQSEEKKKELLSIGIPESAYNSAEFKAFSGQFKESVPMTEVWKQYQKATNTTNIESIGSMKNGNHGEEKTYYSPEDVDKLTEKDYENPVTMRRVRESMLRWPKN